MHTLKVIKYRGELGKPHGPQMSHFVGFAILNTSTARIRHFCTYGELMCTELQYCNFAKGFFFFFSWCSKNEKWVESCQSVIGRVVFTKIPWNHSWIYLRKKFRSGHAIIVCSEVPLHFSKWFSDHTISVMKPAFFSSYSWKEIFAKLGLLSWNKNTSDNLLSYLIVKYLLL